MKVSKLDAPTLIANLKAGLKVSEIAKNNSVTPQTIRNYLRTHGIDLRLLKSYKDNKADLLALKQHQIIGAMDEEKISSTSLRDLSMSFNILHNAERLERGQATQNVNFQALIADLKTLEEEEARLKSELKLKEPEPQ